MDLLLKFRTEEFAKQIAQLVRVTGKKSSEVVKSEGRLFVKDVLQMTPPFGTSVSTESLNAQRKIGEKAVARDVRRVFVVLDTSKIRNPEIRADMEKLARKNDLEGIRKLLRYCRIPVRDVMREALPSVHEEMRDSRGRVQRQKNIWVLKKPSVNRIVREKQSHVGKAKSGWVEAARKLGVSVPNWVSRHKGAGEFIDRTHDPKKPMIRVGNKVQFIQGTGAQLLIVMRALKNRARNMRAKLERIDKSGWKKG